MVIVHMSECNKYGGKKLKMYDCGMIAHALMSSLG